MKYDKSHTGFERVAVLNKKLTVFSVMLILIFAIAAVLIIFSETGQEEKVSSAPRLNNGRKWNIAYLQSGEDSHNTQILKASVDGLARLGWLKPVNWAGLGRDAGTRQCWDYISDNISSDYLMFAKNAYWSSEWQISKRNYNRREILSRLNDAKDIDLLIALGVWSGQDLATNLHKVPVLVISSINPKTAGIIRDDEQAFPHIFAKYDPEIISRQIRMFHLLTGFRKLGVVYDPSDNTKLFSNIEELKSASSEKKFEVVTKTVSYSSLPPAEAAGVLFKAYEELSREADAIWITAVIDTPYLLEIMKSVHKSKIPTWSPYGERFVEAGVLFGVRTFPAENAADYAEAIAMIFNGMPPRDINQIISNRYELIINHATAKVIDYKIPRGLLFATDNNYLTFKSKEKK